MHPAHGGTVRKRGDFYETGQIFKGIKADQEKDRPAKASAEVKAGDIITIAFGNKDVKVEVLTVQETVKKEEAKDLFRYL